MAFVVDDRVDAALEARAKGIKVDGVHIGQDDLDPVVARKLLGPDAIIGLSAKTVDEVREANHLPEDTIDYVGAYAPMTSEDNHVFNMIYSKYA